MSNIRATVLIPTHEHGPLLALSVGSALAQTVAAIEVFIVCDGAGNDTLSAAEDLRDADDRIRVFANEKGPRHGEIHRHQALLEAAGDIVCYLADDDLWLPNHIATMADLLDTADFAHAYPIGLRSDGQVFSWPGHLSLAEVRQAMCEGRNFIPLSCGAHTLELYRRLPHGWRTTPEDTFTDLYMWQQIVSLEDVQLASGEEATVLHFPSSERAGMTIEQRREELAHWSEAMTAADFATDLNRRVRHHGTIEWASSHLRNGELGRQLRGADERLNALEDRFVNAADDLHRLNAERETLLAELGETKQIAATLRRELALIRVQLTEERKTSGHYAERVVSLEAQVSELRERTLWIEASRWWRVRTAILSLPGVAWFLRTVGVARSG